MINNLDLRITLIIGTIALIGLLIRLLALNDRPVHTDEAVNAVILGNMLPTGAYQYNPSNSHGPLFYYLSYPLLVLLGDRSLADMQAWHLRLLPAIIGAITIASLTVWHKIIPRTTLIFAACFLAISAPLVYYQRYAIHESLYLLLSLIVLRLIMTFDNATENMRLKWAALGSVIGLLFATKETAPLVIIAGAVSFFAVTKSPIQTPSLRHIAWLLLPMILITTIFYTSFGTNLHGLSDLLAAVFRYTDRLAGEGHEKPLWTYLSWLLLPTHFSIPWCSWLIMPLTLASFWLTPPSPIRFVAVYSLITLLLYSVIPYKTPWLEINILAPATLSAGYTTSKLWTYFGQVRSSWIKGLAISAALILLNGMASETRTLCFINLADSRNPLAYSPTVPDVDNLVGALADRPSTQSIAVISSDYWPLPWYLRRFSSVGYWNAIPDKRDAGLNKITALIVITSPDLLDQVLAKMPPNSSVRYFGLRPEVLAILITAPSKTP